MSLIHLTTFIAAPATIVFDLSRSIDLHKISIAASKEEAIAGTTSGLINKDETVTWRAKHLFKVRKFTSKIVEMEPPFQFTDEMIQGDFKSYKHQHVLKPAENGTILIDKISFESPFGIIGKLFNRLYLASYLTKLLANRNKVIKEYAETGKWKTILN